MKENWESTKSLHTLKANEIEEMFHSFMPDNKLISFQLLGNGLSNLNYKLHVEFCENPFILRISDEKNCKFENSLHCKLHTQLPVPKIYYSKYQDHHSYSVMEWKKGVHLKEIMYGKDVSAIRQSGFSVGYWLSKIRENKFINPGFFNENLEIIEPLKITPDTFIMIMKEFLIDGQTCHWLGKELTRKYGILVI
ncbi:hypothetical protein KYJ98_08370 [Mammaliicoccus lentus]|uniref:hypothetical protein n=1 Tax=Mammaliicoccus lentus TaxID=42858 RepID=UPI001C4DE6E4|nr:hypothetical protein [Mammaliicoccus lentus]MBW0770360.1 hypothetical protein [Mammaliicoccus lentus]